MMLHRSIPAACILAASLAALGTTEPAAGADAESLLRSYVAAWNGTGVESLEEIVEEDFARHGNYGAASSRSDIEDLIRRYQDFYRNLRVEIDDLIVGDDKAAMRWRFSGGFGTTDFEINAVNFSMFHLENGRIAAEWVVGNAIDFWTGMGYTVMPPGTKMIPPPIDDESPSPSPPPVDGDRLISSADEMRQQATKSAGELAVSADVDCRLVLDGTDLGWLAAGRTVPLPAERGTHLLEASSRGGSVFYRETIEVRKRKQTAVSIQAPGRVIVHPLDRTTEDLQTGLMWQLADNGDDISQTAAAEYCSDSVHGGHDDWRLPTIFELEGLYDPGTAGTKRFHTIPGITLTGCCPWTSTTHGDFHWTFVFYNGLRYIKFRSIGKFSRALCVRETWERGRATTQP